MSGYYAGGVVGVNKSDGTVTACYATGSVTSTSGTAGGVVGVNDSGTVDVCYWSGNQTQGIGGGNQATDPEYSPSGNNGEIPPKNKVPDGTTWEDAVEAMNAQVTGYIFGGDMNNPTLTKN